MSGFAGRSEIICVRPVSYTHLGCTKLITCLMSGARNEESAERLAKAVVGSSLVKAAMFGADANWGRVLCAMGYSKAPFRPEYVDVAFRSAAGEILVCKPVSYTHLDVYKRQILWLPLRNIPSQDNDYREASL